MDNQNIIKPKYIKIVTEISQLKRFNLIITILLRLVASFATAIDVTSLFSPKLCSKYLAKSRSLGISAESKNQTF